MRAATVKAVDDAGNEVELVECGNCAALIRYDVLSKHEAWHLRISLAVDQPTNRSVRRF